MKIKDFIKLLTILISIVFINNCGGTTDPVTGEKVIIDPNPVNRAKEQASRSGGIFGDISGNKKSGTTFEFATSNVLWRATLKTLEFLPLLSVDYQGGIIIYDWYEQESNSDEKIKISVRFVSNEIRSDSVQVTAHKKVCKNSENCKTQKIDDNFSNQIKENILSSARSLRIEENKKKNN
jgi:hypothetical protein